MQRNLAQPPQVIESLCGRSGEGSGCFDPQAADLVREVRIRSER
jgi:hypothetical protein